MIGPQGQFVLVVDADGKVSQRPVKTGSMAGGDFVIEEGVQVGEQVIVDGLQKGAPRHDGQARTAGTPGSPR